MDRSVPSPLQAHLATRIKNLREARGLLQDDLARDASARCGLSWSRTTVAQIESGRRELPLGEILMLPALFHAELGDILCGGATIETAPGVHITDTTLRAILEGRVLRRRDPKYPIRATHSDSSGEADQRAADRLGVDVDVVMTHARHLWGHSLTAERDARVTARTEDATPARRRALRGRVTRLLTDELAESIRRSRKKPQR